MILDSGHYRGFEITWAIADGTDGQMWITFRPYGTFAKEHFKSLTENEIRETFNLPKEDGSAFGFHLLPNENEFNWCFMFSGLGTKVTRYEYLNYLFSGVDKLINIIKSKIDTGAKQK